MSPSYDLTPTPAVAEERRDLAMACGAQGRYAKAANLIGECRRFLLDPQQAEKIIGDVERTHPVKTASARFAGLSDPA